MTRTKRFLAGMITGYGNIAANIFFTMASVPLALYYLDKESFGLWALAAQINGYLSLIDLGMSGAISRFIADFKDDVNGGKYGSHLVTGSIVFAIQGSVIAAVGIGFSWFADVIFAIPDQLAGDFRWLLGVLAGMTGISVICRSLGSPLWSFQRYDVLNGLATLSILVNLAFLLLGFSHGWGVISFAIAQLPMLVASPLITAFICHRKHYYPSKGHWGRPDVTIFKRMFQFGKDLLLINVGSQLINASQIMIITRWVGLDAAATYAVSTKIYTMAMMLVANPIATSGPGLTEMHVRGENQLFVKRYWDLIALVLVISTVAATGLAIANRSFVSLWTDGRIQWPWSGDLALALLIVLRNLNGCLLNLFGLIKNWGPVRHVYLIEGLLFVPVAVMLAEPYGVVGVLAASLIAHVLATTTLSARAASRIIGSPKRVRKGLLTSFVLISVASVIGFYGAQLNVSASAMLAVACGVCLLFLIAAWHLILPIEIRREIIMRLSSTSTRLRLMFSRAS